LPQAANRAPTYRDRAFASYLGDEWVHWVGVRAYNRNKSGVWCSPYHSGAWCELAHLLTHDPVRAPTIYDVYSQRKPFMVAEFCSVEHTASPGPRAVAPLGAEHDQIVGPHRLHLQPCLAAPDGAVSRGRVLDEEALVAGARRLVEDAAGRLLVGGEDAGDLELRRRDAGGAVAAEPTYLRRVSARPPASMDRSPEGRSDGSRPCRRRRRGSRSRA
jgi:hypothetical protein